MWGSGCAPSLPGRAGAGTSAQVAMDGLLERLRVHAPHEWQHELLSRVRALDIGSVGTAALLLEDVGVEERRPWAGTPRL